MYIDTQVISTKIIVGRGSLAALSLPYTFRQEVVKCRIQN
jgi:hypothetical protein